MANIARKVLFGDIVEETQYEKTSLPPRLVFYNQNRTHSFAMDEPTVFRNLLLLGSAGSGKTNIANQIVAQTRAWCNTEGGDGVCLIFDTKGDYISHKGFYRPGDYLLGNDIRFRARSNVWNIFDEILADGDDPVDYEANAKEISGILFRDRGSQSQPFFANAARDIFANMLVYFVRRRRDSPVRWSDKLNNRDFITFMLSKDPGDFTGFFQFYSDMKGLISYIGDGSSNQALGVFGELRSMIYDCFQGVFAQRPEPSRPAFSIRKAIRNKGGHAIFIEYDLSLGETMAPIYRLLVDLALKESLSEASNGHTHLFLDELKLLPKVMHLEDALNFGRSKRVSVVAGLQSIEQIYSLYGRDKGQEILGGFGSVFAFRSSDYASREYISTLFGSNIYSYRYYSDSNQPIDREHEGHTVEHWHIQNLRNPGDGYIYLASQTTPFRFYFCEDKD
ncbi:MAG: type IV secretion system DNA-binding domain-containing protein [Lachnospiraceae bacterium]|nr:type IV secretion system DNA-binding domain-containing protein [Lachnospiraceae bacterium]